MKWNGVTFLLKQIHIIIIIIIIIVIIIIINIIIIIEANTY